MKPSRRWWLALLLAAPVLLGLWRLRFDTDVLNLLPDDLPSVTGLKLYQRYFSNNREIVITVTANSSDESESAARMIAEKLRAATNLVADAVWQPPWMDHPEETAEFLAWLWLSRPAEEVAALQKKLAEAPAVLNETRERLATSLSPLDLARLSHDPFGLSNLGGGLNQNQDWFASPDGKFRLIFVQPRTVPKRFEDWAVWLNEVRALAKSDVGQIAFTGAPVFFVETALGMKGDMMQSIVTTIVLVGALFWWAHRRFWPLLWMLTMLVSSLLVTMSLGGLIFGSLNVVSFGFAAILLGLGVDYALVLYQELLSEPGASAAHVRADAAKGIWWSAGTTALAFGLLNFAGLPGLGQLGTLVGAGVMIAATAMLYGFLPMMTRRPPTRRVEVAVGNVRARDRFAWPVTVLAAVAGGIILARAWPGIDRSAQPLGSVNSEAARAAKEIDERINRGSETIWLVAQGRDEAEMRARLQEASGELKNVRVDLPLEIWPRPELQKQNVSTLRGLTTTLPGLERAVVEAGFTDEALDLTKSIFKAWNSFATNGSAIWPQSASALWLTHRIAAKSESGWLALGLIHLAPNEKIPTVRTQGVLIASWSHLAEDLLHKIERRLTVLTFVMAALLVICLRLALRGWIEVLLSFGALAFGFMLTLLVMALVGWKWNLLSLTAIPLLLGAAVDYTIHVQLALNRYHDDARAMRRTIGRALFLVTAAAVAGFASLAFASNAGLASFEIICAVGMICIFLTSLYLLPAWHDTFARSRKDG